MILRDGREKITCGLQQEYARAFLLKKKEFPRVFFAFIVFSVSTNPLFLLPSFHSPVLSLSLALSLLPPLSSSQRPCFCSSKPNLSFPFTFLPSPFRSSSLPSALSRFHSGEGGSRRSAKCKEEEGISKKISSFSHKLCQKKGGSFIAEYICFLNVA